jgi:DNA primase
MASAIAKHGLGIDGKVKIVNDLRPTIMGIRDPVARSLRIKQLAEKVGVEEQVLLHKLKKPETTNAAKPWGSANPNHQVHADSKKRYGETYRLERQVIAMMLQFPEMIDEIKHRRLMDHFADRELVEIGEGIIDHFSRAGSDISGLLSRWEDTEKRGVIARLALTDEQWDRKGCVNLMKQFAETIRRRDKSLLQRIEAAEKSGDEDLLAKLLKEKQHQIQQRGKGHPGFSH